MKKLLSALLSASFIVTCFATAGAIDQSTQEVMVTYERIISQVNEKYGLNYRIPSDAELAEVGLSNLSFSEVNFEDFSVALDQVAMQAAQEEANASVLSNEITYELHPTTKGYVGTYKYLTKSVTGATATLSAWCTDGANAVWTSDPTITTTKVDDPKHRFVGDDNSHTYSLINVRKTFSVTLKGTMWDLTLGIWLPRDATQEVRFDASEAR